MERVCYAKVGKISFEVDFISCGKGQLQSLNATRVDSQFRKRETRDYSQPRRDVGE